jgi:hypothetical protein
MSQLVQWIRTGITPLYWDPHADQPGHDDQLERPDRLPRGNRLTHET